MEIFGEAAVRLGVGMTMEILDPESKLLGELRWDSRRRRIHASHLPLNDSLSHRLADDKFYTGLLLERAGFQVPRTVRCPAPGDPFPSLGLADGAAAARGLAQECGFPLIVKPNQLFGGRLAACVRDLDALYLALDRIWDRRLMALAQQYVPGTDHRLDFLDGRFLIGYVRHPLRLVGDGASSLGELASRRDPRFEEEGRWSVEEAPEWGGGRFWSRHDVPSRGEVVELGVEVRDLNRFNLAAPIFEVPGPWLEAGRRLARELGLRHLGVDFRADSLEQDPARATVIEVNAAPSLTQLYRLGYREEVLDAYGKVLLAAFEDSSSDRLHG